VGLGAATTVQATNSGCAADESTGFFEDHTTVSYLFIYLFVHKNETQKSRNEQSANRTCKARQELLKQFQVIQYQ